MAKFYPESQHSLNTCTGIRQPRIRPDPWFTRAPAWDSRITHFDRLSTLDLRTSAVVFTTAQRVVA